MIKLIKLKEMNKEKEIWNKISNLGDISSLKILENKAIITVIDNIYATEFQLLKSVLLEKIKVYYEKVNDIEIKVKNKKTIKINENQEVDYNKMFHSKIKELKEKYISEYSTIENKNLRDYIVNIRAISDARTYINELRKEKKCKRCGEYNKDDFCIICYNERIATEKSQIKYKLIQDYSYTKEYAIKIDSYLDKSYEIARDEILKDKFNIYMKSRKEKDLEIYINFLIQSNLKMIVEIEKEKIKKHIKEMENKNDYTKGKHS